MLADPVKSLFADPLGLALSDHLRHPSAAAILVSSDIVEDEQMPVTHFFRSETLLSELERMALAACRGRVLDVGAGAGSLSLLLQERGLAVTAIDVSAGAVQVMARRGVADARCTALADFAGETYDTLLLIMNGAGVAGTLEGLERFLEQAKTLLRPGGQILLDSADIMYLYEDETGGYWIDLNGPYHGEVTYWMEYQGCKGEPFPWLFVGFDVLADYAEAAGFVCERLYTDENEQYLARLTAI